MPGRPLTGARSWSSSVSFACSSWLGALVVGGCDPQLVDYQLAFVGTFPSLPFLDHPVVLPAHAPVVAGSDQAAPVLVEERLATEAAFSFDSVSHDVFFLFYAGLWQLACDIFCYLLSEGLRLLCEVLVDVFVHGSLGDEFASGVFGIDKSGFVVYLSPFEFRSVSVLHFNKLFQVEGNLDAAIPLVPVAGETGFKS